MVRFGYVCLRLVRIGLVRIGLVRLGLVCLRLVRFGLFRFVYIWLGLVRLWKISSCRANPQGLLGLALHKDIFPHNLFL